MPNYPVQINQQWLDNRADAKEKSLVRIELRGCNNHRPFALSGKSTHRYLFSHDPKTNCHVLDVPESLWMANNGWMARDVMSVHRPGMQPLVALVLPYRRKVAAPKPLPKAEKTISTKTPEERALAALGK